MNSLPAQKKKRQRQQGVAIVLSLGVLALMLVYTLSFAVAALNNQKFAELNRALTEVRTECESRVQMVLNQMATNYMNTAAESHYYPGTNTDHMVAGTGVWSGFRFTGSTVPAGRTTDGLAELLKDQVDALNLVPDELPSNLPLSWIPVHKERTIDGQLVEVLYSRYAFLLIDESGKLDPNHVLDSGVVEGMEPLQGIDVNELNLTTAGVAASVASSLASKPTNADWFSRYHMIRANNFTQAQMNALRNVTYPYSFPDTLESQQNAFNLAEVLTLTPTPEELVAAIPWLTNWSMSGDFPTAQARALNLAANIIDYADSDGNATRDDDVDPTYWGVERVPWFSRVAFRVTNESYLTHGGSRTRPRISIACQPELVNAFGDLSDTYTNCHVSIEVEVRMTDEANRQKVRTLSFEFDPLQASWNSSGYYRPIAYSTAQNHTSDSINSPSRFALRDIGLRILRMTVKSADETESWDFARTNECELFQLDTVSDREFIEFRALNHASNFFADTWRSSLMALADPFLAPVVEPPIWWVDQPIWIRNGPFQHVVEMGAILRMEPVSDATPEWGFRTFNLVEYKYSGDHDRPGLYSDASDSILYDLDGPPEDEELNGGDRNLLDMVRVGTTGVFERSVAGRVNMNTPRRDVLNALFKRVNAQVYTGGAPIAEARIDTFITNLMAHTAANPIPIGLYSNYRNPPLYGMLFLDNIAGDPANSGANALSEMEREYLLTMTQQLVSGEHNFFKLYVVAQLIRDRGVPAPNEVEIDGVMCQYGRYDLGGDQIIVEQKMKVVLYRNAFTNHIRILRKQFLAE